MFAICSWKKYGKLRRFHLTNSKTGLEFFCAQVSVVAHPGAGAGVLPIIRRQRSYFSGCARSPANIAHGA